MVLGKLDLVNRMGVSIGKILFFECLLSLRYLVKRQCARSVGRRPSLGDSSRERDFGPHDSTFSPRKSAFSLLREVQGNATPKFGHLRSKIHPVSSVSAAAPYLREIRRSREFLERPRQQLLCSVSSCIPMQNLI